MMRAILIAALGVSSVAWAQEQTPSATAAPKVKVERSASGQKIFRITEGIVVEGKIQKPNAFYVLQRSSMDYDWESLKKDFLPKILEAASHHPF
ncbi:MAG TPA: hypothetical protein VN947_30585 [Polyangia bacterium]|nr:hypothetical protein [Polyangia bacterium]